MAKLLVFVKLQKAVVFMYVWIEKGPVERHFFRLLILGYALQHEKNIASIVILASIRKIIAEFVIIKLMYRL